MSIAEDLKRLADLHAAGDLTDAEYSRAKERHLARGTAPSSSGALLGGVGLAVILLLVSIFGVGILAAIAIPNFVEMQLRAKRAELPANVEGIRTAELAAYAASGAYIAVPELAPRPLDELDKLQVDWVEATASTRSGGDPMGACGAPTAGRPSPRATPSSPAAPPGASWSMPSTPARGKRARRSSGAVVGGIGRVLDRVYSRA